MAHDEQHSSDDRELGMDRAITRRDFLNGVAIGIGGRAGRPVVAGAGVALRPDRPFDPAQGRTRQATIRRR